MASFTYSHCLRATSYTGLLWCIVVITLQALPYLLIVEQQLLLHDWISQHMILCEYNFKTTKAKQLFAQNRSDSSHRLSES